MIKVKQLAHVCIFAHDLEATRAFYRDVWGLEDAGAGDGMAYLAAAGDEEPFVVRLRQAPEKRIDVIALAAARNP